MNPKRKLLLRGQGGLQSAVQSEAQGSQQAGKASDPSPSDPSTNSKGLSQKPCRGGKMTKKEMERMHAESQRLLRETKGLAFDKAPMVVKPLTGLIQKLLARRAELGWTHCSSLPAPAEALDSVQEADASQESPRTCTNTLKPAVDNTQDLFDDVELPPSGDVEALIQDAPSLRLHLDAEQQTDLERFEQPDQLQELAGAFDGGEVHQQPLHEASSVLYSSSVTKFVDCEAQDEDGPQKATDEDDDDANEVLEIIEPSKPEALDDILNRKKLHQQWLEEEDEAQAEDLIRRLVPALEVEDVKVRSRHRRKDGLPSFGTRHLLQQDKKAPVLEESDDEEIDRQILHWHAHQAVEAEHRWLPAAEDESCRRMLELIKKVNVPPPKTKPVKDAAGPSKNLKPAFVNRKASSSSFVGRKKTRCSITRPFVFRSTGFFNPEAAKEPTPKMPSEQGPSPLLAILRGEASKTQDEGTIADQLSMFSRKNLRPKRRRLHR